MSDKTNIEWTDATWNPTAGCSVISPGCKHCYAMKTAHRWRFVPDHKFSGLTQDGAVWNGTVRLWEPQLDQPLRWKKPRRIFVNSMSDLFHEALSDDDIARVFAVMALAPRHTFQVLTKRAKRMRDWFASMKFDHFSRLPNVHLGVSVEDQARADERIPLLLETPAAVRFLSCEPLLGPVDLAPLADKTYQRLSEWYGPNGFDPTGSQPRRERMTGYFPRIDWVIVGGESGPGARPMHPDWARSIRDQCASAAVPFFFKQWGEWIEVDGPRCRAINQELSHAGHWMTPNGQLIERNKESNWRHTVYATSVMAPIGKHAAGRLLDGREHNEFPVIHG